MKAVMAVDIFMSYLKLSITSPSDLAALNKEPLFWIRILAGGSPALWGAACSGVLRKLLARVTENQDFTKTGTFSSVLSHLMGGKVGGGAEKLMVKAVLVSYVT